MQQCRTLNSGFTWISRTCRPDLPWPGGLTAPLRASDQQAPFLTAGPLGHPPGLPGETSAFYLRSTSVLPPSRARTVATPTSQGNSSRSWRLGHPSTHRTALQGFLCKHQQVLEVLLFSSRGVIFPHFPTVACDKEQLVLLTKGKAARVCRRWSRPGAAATAPSEDFPRAQSGCVIHRWLLLCRHSVVSLSYYNEHF